MTSGEGSLPACLFFWCVFSCLHKAVTIPRAWRFAPIWRFQSNPAAPAELLSVFEIGVVDEGLVLNAE